ncbi:MAG TPA: menaquinone biosynthesis protein [Terriglobales bacterium]|nr:menaquinone biosynthesis protein [Terriglobales bacterium]
MSRLRISAISFLNTAPLMWDFEHPSPGQRRLQDQFEITYTVPSNCAAELSAGTADIGIIPSITYATIPGLAILPDAAIAARNAVRSILLVLNQPLEQVRTVALDTSSRTSVALTQILFSKYFPGSGMREYVAMAPDLDQMLGRCDAALLIGDSALQVDRARYTALDLAEEWHRFTGKPFVFAFWAVRMAALVRGGSGYDLAEVFSRSRDHGLEPENLDVIAGEWAARVNLTPDGVKSYLTENIHYTLDPENTDGLELFYRYAADLGLIPEAPALRLLGTPAFRLYR